ncbi:DUF4142 domain-containing protein [uncultured Mucilaginibacter sp.]|uniref:DUF4142 domain-containing protein n=1 Tax=uncultured Mucilaginibacter sp. TaxID=797541 RepID=UPI0025FCD099|nr:DUF4142 domain-containing protein [uncultured Mucilaginibacter sp.]
MKNILYLSAFAFFAISATSCNDNKKARNYNQKTTVDDQGINFIKEAHMGGLMEIKFATVAQSKAQNPRVLNFAKMLIADHTTALNELNELADDKDVPKQDTTLLPDQQKMIDSVAKLSGAAFDKAYMQMMVTDHGKDIELYKEATGNKIVKVRKYAEKTLPVLTTHLDSAKAISASLK